MPRFILKIPYEGTDTWIWERWEPVPAGILDHQLGRALRCETCGPRRREPAVIYQRDPLVWFDLEPDHPGRRVIEAPASTDHAALRIAAATGCLPHGWRWVPAAEFPHGAERDTELFEVWQLAPW